MPKSIPMSVAAIAAALIAWLLLPPLRSHEARADTGPLSINVIELDIVPDDFDKFIAASKDNAESAVKNSGRREFDISVSQKDPNHVLFYEVWGNPAALGKHLATDHYKTYAAITKDMVAKRDVRQFSSVAMNTKGM